MKAIEVARAFLKLSEPAVGDTVSNLKLQKLLYYAQGFYVAINKEPLFLEDILAWEHGPVVREVYDIFSKYGSDSIPTPDENIELSEKDRGIITDVWNVYGQFSAWRLRDMTHNESPWQTTPRNSVITLEKLEEFFKTLVVDDA